MNSSDNTSLNPTGEELQMLARARATFSSFVNAHFLNLPDEEFVQQLRSAEHRLVLGQLQDSGTLHPDISEGARLMDSYLEQQLGLNDKELSEALGVDRTRLYRGVSPTYGPPPPYEAVWSREGNNAPALLQKIASIYRKHGLAQAPDAAERLDYIGIELAFIQELAQEEAEAWEAGEADRARSLLAGQSAFIREHLINWVPAFIETALEFAGTDFYRGHLRLLRGFLLDQETMLS